MYHLNLFRLPKLTRAANSSSMAPKPQKRKAAPEGAKSISKKSNSSSSTKKPKLVSSTAQDDVTKKPSKYPEIDFIPSVKDEAESAARKLARLRSKELTEARKKKRKMHYSLEQELALLWEKMRGKRRQKIAPADRSRLVTEALSKMKGKISEIACSHVSSRVLQTCVKFCTNEERKAVFTEIRPKFITLASNTYAVRLVTKIIENASKELLSECISSLHGHVASLLRHMVGSLVIEEAYTRANAPQKQALLSELYSAELQKFKDMVPMEETRLADVISKRQLSKSAVLRHMISVLQPILEKGIIDHSIVHKALMEYLSICDKTSAAEILEQLMGLDLARMIHTKEGSRLVILCIKNGSAKDRKKIIKAMKGKIGKAAKDKFGSMVLACLLSVVDDTKLLAKVVVKELEENLKELVLHKSGSRPLLQLLHPNSTQYFNPGILESLNVSIPSLSTEGELDDIVATKDEKNEEGNKDSSKQLTKGGKKDPLKRRQELLVDSGLAENLVDVCNEVAGDLLRSRFTKHIIYEVAVGGADGILRPSLCEKLGTLHKKIASLAALPKHIPEKPLPKLSKGGKPGKALKFDKPENDHVLTQFDSSRIIRKLILDSPEFASTLWKNALKGNCSKWVQGYSSKVISAYLKSSSPEIKKLAKAELQPFVDNGELNTSEVIETTI